MEPLTVFAELAYTLKPGATGRDLVAMTDGRAERTLLLHWRAGRTNAPRWALELLASKLEARAREFNAAAEKGRKAKERPGLKAGALNLARWRAERAKRP